MTKSLFAAATSLMALAAPAHANDPKAAIAALGAASVVNLSRLHRTAADLCAKCLPSVGALAAVRVAIRAVREREMKHSRAAAASYRAEYEDWLDKALAKASTSLADDTQIPHDANGLKLADAFVAKWQEYLGFHQKVIACGGADQADDARDLDDGAAKRRGQAARPRWRLTSASARSTSCWPSPSPPANRRPAGPIRSTS